jgi:hypothetical protein
MSIAFESAASIVRRCPALHPRHPRHPPSHSFSLLLHTLLFLILHTLLFPLIQTRRSPPLQTQSSSQLISSSLNLISPSFAFQTTSDDPVCPPPLILCYKHRRLGKIGIQEIGEVHHFWLGLIAAFIIVGLRTEGAGRNLLASGFHVCTDSKFTSDWYGCVQVRESEIV